MVNLLVVNFRCPKVFSYVQMSIIYTLLNNQNGHSTCRLIKITCVFKYLFNVKCKKDALLFK